jgi:hypothetical protein
MSKRSRLLVDPSVQWSIAGRILIHWGFFLVCLVSLGALVRILVAVGNQPFSEAWKAAVISQIPTLGVMLALLPLFTRDTLKLSNRFAGPMFRLRTSLRNLATDQSVGPIKFRDGDFWQEAASDFNEVLKKIESLQSENDSLKSELANSREWCETH